MNRRALLWSFVGIAAWLILLRGLATGSAHACAIDAAELGRRTVWILRFLECSPRLLSGSAADVFFFVFVWAGLLLSVAFLGYLLLCAFRSNPVPKEP